ncbi:IgGFc-binding protein [Synchiropus picturatus]
MVTSDKVHISSDAPLQLLYFRHDSEKHSSTLTSLLAVDDICEVLPMSDSSDSAEPEDNHSGTEDVKLSSQAKLSDSGGGEYSETDVGRYLSTLTRESYPEACEKASCEEMHCGHKHDCYFRDEKPQCSLRSKMCSAWGDSFYRSFNGNDFVLLGNCNYTLVQTNCPGSNSSLWLQINIARAYLSSATLSNIHTVQINFQGFNISIVREEINYIRLNGRKRSLPLALKDGSLKLFPSGSSVVLVTSFGLTLHYDWLHHLQIEVTQELYGAICGLCGGARTGAPKSGDSPIPWVVNSGGSCFEDCQGATCKVCPHDQRHLGNSIKCSLLKRPNGPFENCHQYVDPEAFARSCIDNLCITGMDFSGCKILEAYTNVCQRLGARIKDWRGIIDCPKTCPQNSHYEHCGTSCPATCADPEASLNCSLPCVESCQCNSGYLLSDGKCVEQTSCGCIHEGFYFPPKKSFWIGEQCEEKCVCQPHSRKVMCAGAQCSQGEVCKVLDGERTCHRHGPGFCVAKGDPHYTTFDGHRFDVHGNCSYLFTSYCPSWGALGDFSVEVQNQMKDANNVSFRRVKMTAVGYSIELSYKWRDKIKVNGLLLNLPLMLNRGKIKVYQSGRSTTLETDFGVVLTYTSDVLIVQVPKIFSGSLCGLCGNFNDNPNDDLAVKDGASQSDAIGSWKTSSDCVDNPLHTPGCRAEDVVLYQGMGFCGRLLAKDGVFQACHDVVDPQDFFDSCVYDLCHDKQKDLCQILSTYVLVCQEKGALMDEWRSPSFCDLACPANSEYQLCSTERFDCVETGLKSVACKEGCFCKPGFFHNTVGCVPNSKCGCFSHGSYHFVDEVFYPDDHCRQHCVCVGHDKVQCSNHTCPAGTGCFAQDGDRGCHKLPRSKCSILGEGHFTTYNGEAFDLELGSCRYLLSQVCDDDDAPSIEMERSKMYLRYRGVHVLLDAEYLEKVKIDGVLVGLPLQLEHISVLHFGSLTRVFVDTGMVVTFGGAGLMQVEIPAVEGKICGLCGQRMDSNQLKTAEVGSSWLRRPHGTNCSPPNQSAKCNAQSLGRFSSDGLCGRLLAPGGAFRKCHDIVNPQPFFQNCLKDLCVSDNEDSLCSILREYTFVCQDAGAAVEPWRGAKCSLACPDNSHYNMCAGTCPASCGSPSNIPCQGTCYEGCQCDAGYVQSGSQCVRPEQCGCLHEGHYHEVGDVFWTEGCYERCNCSATAKLRCEPAACPEGESCTLHDTWNCAGKACPPNSHYETCGSACPATCQVPSGDRPCTLACVPGCHCDPGFVLDGDTCVPLSHCGCTYNGERYLGNQTFWADESCTEQCYCDPNTYQTHCKLSSCSPDEYCGLEDGVISCILHQWQLCTYTGHHLTTFDHHDYDLHGTCQYQLLGFCEGGHDLDVQVHIQSDGHPLSAVNVLIKLSDVVVKLDSDSVEVNGTKKNLPFHFNMSTVAFSLGLHMYFYTDLGFGLSLSREGLLAIGVSRKYANSTCGLCGNFNGDPSDDLTSKGTKNRLSPEGFVKVWKSEQDHWCVDGCLGGSCPTCTPERSLQYSDLQACGKILEVGGPFRHCHGKVDPSSFYQHCISDLCRHGYHLPLLCRALSAYTAACLVRKAEVLPWSRPDFCGDSCPANTRYSTHFSSVHLCLGWGNRTVELPLYTAENCVCEAGLVHSGSHCVLPKDCGCFLYGEYMRAGQTVVTCEQSCTCRAGGHVACFSVSCGEDEECSFVGGVRGCHPKPKVADCSLDGTHYTTFDGQIFDFHGSCNYSLVETCRPKSSGGHLFIYTSGNYSLGRQISVQVKNMSLKISSDFPGFVQVNGVYENIPFSQAGLTVYQENEWRIIRAPMVEMTSDLHNHIRVRLSSSYRHTTCGLCGNYNRDPTDDMKLRSGSVVTDAEVFGASWKSGNDSNCSDSCDDSCHLCMAALPEYTSKLYCGVITLPQGPFAPCHGPVSPQKYYSFCMESLCVTKGAKWALCDALQTYAAACKEAGVVMGRWRADTGCGRQCPQFSHFSRCANVCASLCPETRLPLQCPTDCEEGCACDARRLYDGHACVARDRCGCMRNGQSYKVSESRLLHNCTLNCTCGPPLICELHKCPSTHSCQIVDGRAGCWMKALQHQDPCAKCGPSEKCYLSKGKAVCGSRPGQCWAWGSRHHYTFDGLEYNFESSCTYLLAGSKGEDCCLPPFIVSKKNNRKTPHYLEVVTVQVYGFVIKLNDFTVHVNGQAQTLPFTLSKGKIEVSYKHGRALLKTDFGLQVLFDWRTTVSVTIDSKYQGVVYGLCGNFNGNPQDEFASKSAAKMSSSLTHLYRVFDGDDGCAEEGNTMVPLADAVSKVSLSYKKACDALKDPHGPYAQCHGRINPDSFFQSCLTDMMQSGEVKESVERAMNSYSMLCEAAADEPTERSIEVSCPENSHFKTCGSACPPTCERNVTVCRKICAEGCFCDPGFIRSPQGCVQPQQCGCTDSRGNYHRLNTTFWIPESCGQLCVCSQAGTARCSPSHCPKGMVCKRGKNVDLCLPEKSLNCTIVSGLHFTTFDGDHFDFSDSCAYSLVQTHPDLKGLEPFNVTVSDASCHRRLFHSRSIKLSIHGLEFEVRKDDPGKLLVGGEHMPLPLAHHTGHVNAFHTPSSLVIHTDVGLQLMVYETGSVTVVIPSSYDSSVVGLCGNANGNPRDDRLMPNKEPALNTLEFVHSWRLGGAESCRSVCSSKAKRCSPEAQEQFEGSDFCGILVNELGPFADCASVLDPDTYFHNCVVDACSHGGHYTAVCNSIAAYAAACQSAHLPVRHWRSDTFCGMSCPQNSHYELCGPRCPVTCAGLSSPPTCSGGCEEGCQCDPGYVLSDGQCVLVSDCGCMHEERYYTAGLYYSGRSCQKCNCKRERSCRPSPCSPSVGFPVKGGLVPYRPLDYGVCEVFQSYGYVTFDGLVVPLHGACTYLLSSLTSTVMHDYTLLISFDSSSGCSISRLEFRFLSMEVVIDPASLWKIQVNGEDHIVPFDNGFVKASQEGSKLSVASPSGVRLVLSSSCILRLIVPQEHNATASGLCGNFNGDKSDDLEMPDAGLARGFGEFLQSWAAVVPGQRCADTCGELCGECNVSPVTAMACDVLTISTAEFNPCWARGVEPQLYKDVCLRAICSGAGHVEAVCLALEAFAAACEAKGVTLVSWRKGTSCALECPDRSSPSECVEVGSDSCPALLQSGSSVAACSAGCKCDHGNVFDGSECVPYSQCGCFLHHRYIKMDEQLYTENCAERCWCHPLGGVICETAGCSPGQYCALRNGSWGCHEEPSVCRLTSSLDVSTFAGQRLNLQSQLSYNLMSVCNEASDKWFSIISFHGPCEPTSARESSVFQIHLLGSSVVVSGGTVKVNGLHVPLPHTLSSGVTLSAGVTPDKSEVLVLLRRDSGTESELQMDIGVTMVTLRVTPWFSGKLCGLCGNLDDRAQQSAASWVLPNVDGCDSKLG